MALVQSDGDISFAAEILFQMNDKTIKAIKKIEKQKRRKQSSIPHFNAVCLVHIRKCRYFNNPFCRYTAIDARQTRNDSQRIEKAMEGSDMRQIKVGIALDFEERMPKSHIRL